MFIEQNNRLFLKESGLNHNGNNFTFTKMLTFE